MLVMGGYFSRRRQRRRALVCGGSGSIGYGSVNAVTVSQDIRLGDAKFEIEHIEEFALNSTDITFTENPGT